MATYTVDAGTESRSGSSLGRYLVGHKKLIYKNKASYCTIETTHSITPRIPLLMVHDNNGAETLSNASLTPVNATQARKGILLQHDLNFKQ